MTFNSSPPAASLSNRGKQNAAVIDDKTKRMLQVFRDLYDPETNPKVSRQKLKDEEIEASRGQKRQDGDKGWISQHASQPQSQPQIQFSWEEYVDIKSWKGFREASK